MKKLFAMLLVVVMVFGMLPVYAGAATATPSIDQFSMTLNGILGVNCMVNANGASIDQVKLRFTIGDNVSVQEISDYTRKGEYYVFTASLPSHRVQEALKIELINGDTVVQTKNDWTVEGYLEAVKAANPTDTALIQLCDALWYYCAYAAWNAHDAQAMNVDAVEAVTVEDIGESYSPTITSTEAVYYGASVVFNDALDIRYYFIEDKMGDYTVSINGTDVEPSGTKNGLVYYEIEALMPQQYDDGNTVTVSNGESDVFVLENYGVYSYLYRMLTKATSEDKFLSLLKAVYLYSVAAEQYLVTDGAPIELVDQLLLADNWSNGATVSDSAFTVPANSSLKADYLKALWDAGYTHLVFTVNAEAASDNNTNYTNAGQWDRYWGTFAAATDVDLRIDLNEFHDGDTWYGLNFNAGNMTVSNPRAHKSPETLSWTKNSTNVYFAVEDGYYVLKTPGNDFGVTSPTSWLQKYVVKDDASQRTWLMYTDYIAQGENTRSMLWGWGSAVNTVCGDVNGGWSWNNGVQTDGYTDGEVLSLHMDKAGTARFKLLDWVSNRNEWNSALALSYVDEQTIRWSAASDYKLRLATTQDLIADGYTALKVTLTGDLGSAQIWYGEDDWSDGEICVSAESFADGSYTFEVDLTAFNSGETFTMMANAASFTDLLVKIEPVKPVYYSVTAPTGEGYTFSGADTVLEGTGYSFTVTPNDGIAATVKVNGQEIIGENGSYTVENVTSDLVITVETKVMTTLDKLLTANSWSNGGTVSGSTLTVPANSSLKADYLKALWDEGYTHLVFTVNSTSAGNFIHGGTWDRYWGGINVGTQELRIDLSEFCADGTWYELSFINMSGEMTVSAPKAYKSLETLSWTKSSTNVYFAVEDGYYVLETRGNDFGVTSPTSWLQKYVVKDEAGQRTWLMYTDYIAQGENTRSMLWGWGSAVNTIIGDVNGGWSFINNVQTDGYTDGEVFSLHMDKAGTARFKLLNWVSDRNEWNGALALSYVDEQTIRWSAADSYKLRLATTQDLIAAGYTHLNVTLTGDLGSALIWYGEDDWSDGETAVSADSFVDGAYTFEVDLTAFNSGETFTMMANAASFTDLLVKIEPVQKEIIYSVAAPSGDDFVFEGASTVERHGDYSFTVTPVVDSTTLTVSVNGAVLAPVSGNTYLVENVSENLTISVEAKLFTPEDVVLNADSWTAASSINEDGSLTTGANSQLTGTAMKQLWDEGYTHLVFTVNAEAVDNMNYTHGGEWSRYWTNFDAATDVDIRIDLNEFHDGDTWYSLNFNAGSMTVSNPRVYKSAETLNWTKSSTNIYFALEDGYYVLETRGNDFGVTSPTSWLKKYVVKDDAGQRTWLMYTDYIAQRDNTRSMLWGWGSAVNTVNGDVNGGWSWNNGVQTDGYTDGEVFSLHMDKSGTARFKLLDWVSNRNEWNSALAISYVDEQTIRWSAASDYKIRLATTQDLIADGYTTLKVTLTGDLGSALIWYGEDDWSDGETAVSADSFVDGSYTFEVDLTTFNSGENFTMMANAASFTDLLVKIEPMDKAEQFAVKLLDSNGCSLSGNSYAIAGRDYSFSISADANVTLQTVTVNGVAYTAVDGVYTVPAEAVTGNLVIRVESIVISNAIIVSDESYLETANLLESELEAVSGSYGVYTLSDNVSYKNSILLGTNTEDANVTAETYSVSGDGTNIYIDGNCARAVAYGAADYLRSLGYEFYTADVATRPASVSLNFSMAELTDTADFAVRSYLSSQTSYNENSLSNQAFTVMSKNNNALFATYDSFGGGVETEDFNGGVHNFTLFFADQTEGKYGYTVSTGVGSETGFAPCLTNGITYNVGGADTTLTYAVARMKEAILANPDAYYFSFCQNDGSTWYCGCDYCTADVASHNRSGTLVNFINAMIAQLEADADLSGRDFRIITFAYSFTAQAPSNVSALSDKLQVWYAQWHNANYSINSDSQDLNDYTANLRAWADLTADGNLSLWLYDTHFGNYLAYFPSINTIAANVAEAKALGVSNILVQGSWNAEDMWQAEMKSYIWSKLLWDSSLDVDTLQANFLKAYFGDAAYSSVKTFVDLYDDGVGSSATVKAGYPISNGYGYFCHLDVYKQSTVHSKAINAANAAIAAIAADSSLTDAQKAIYTQRANALLATVYGSVIGNWSGYEKWHDAWFGSDNFDDFETYFGASAAECQAKLTAALEAAGITQASESSISISEWIAYMTNLYNTETTEKVIKSSKHTADMV